ncbi:MAG: metallophosphoesterase family protein [Bacteroidota bacterium]|nr:metallophosphoesterase family protein [Bacteroidota bacterium]
MNILRIAIISDIHSNLEALQKALEIIEQKTVDKVICLGDIVGYGANPKQCLDLTRKISQHIIMGNHDQAAADLSYTQDFTKYAKTAVFWTNKILSQPEKEFLRSLPFTIEIENINFVHSSLFKPQEWFYITNHLEAGINFRYFDTPLCFIGHSHVSEIFCEDRASKKELVNQVITEEINYFSCKYKLLREKKYIINVGSVGQPRDRDWRLSFGIFDTHNWTYENIRAEYDVETTAKKIRKAILPEFLAKRLFIGK